MTLRVLNRFELARELQPDSDGPSPPVYRTRHARAAERLGARKLGFHLCELPPGTALCPYHAHLVNEELFVVLEGRPSVRLVSGEHALRPRDVVALPPGPQSAHQLLNRASEPALLLPLSTRFTREVIEYPDSQKRMLAVADLAGEPGGGAYPSVLAAGPISFVMLHEGRQVDYFEGEPGEGLPPPRPAEGADPRVVSLEDGPWEEHAVGPFAARRQRVGQRAGAARLGISAYRLEPGQRPWPFHFHHANEELFLVLAGGGRLRTADGEVELRTGDLALFPPGPAGAHQLAAAGDGPLEVLAVSTMEHPDVVEYPDSGGVYVMVGSAPGAPGPRELDLVFRRADARAWGEDER